MKVNCINIYNRVTKQFVTKDRWLTIGKTYTVLAIETSVDELLYRIVDDEFETPVLFESSQFEIISDFIPSSWKVNVIGETSFMLGPRKWSEPDFWELFFDDNENAIEMYLEEKRRILWEESNT